MIRDITDVPALPGGLPFDATQIQFTPAGAGAVARSVQAKERDVVSVIDAGADPSGAVAADSSVAKGLGWLTSGGRLFFPSPVVFASYKMTAGATISANHTELDFDSGVTIQCAPTGAMSVFKFSQGATVLNYVGVSGKPTFTSADSTFKKIAIEINDTSEFNIDGIIVGPGSTWAGAGSTGILIKGRELGWINRPQIYADAPISFAANPNTTTQDGDLITIEKFLLVAPAGGGFPCIGAASGAILSALAIRDGVFVGGSDGFSWIDTTSVANTRGIYLENVRWEQTGALGSGHWIVNLSMNNSNRINDVRLLSVSGGSGANHDGFKFRNVDRLELDQCAYTGSGVALDCDSTVKFIILKNFFVQSGATMSMTGLSRVFSMPADPSNALSTAFEIWVPTTNTSPVLIGASGTETPFTATLTGCTTTPTGSVAAIRQGNTITLSVPAFTATSNATTKSLTGMPASFFPSAQLRGVLYAASDNGGTAVLGVAVIEASGVINLFPTPALGNWTAAGVFASHRFSVSYPATL